MKFEVISFDLQGTLSDNAFSDEFWLETLPNLYSESKKVSLEKAKEELKILFKNYGKYDYRYYSLKYWLEELKINLTFDKIVEIMQNKPCFFSDTKELLNELKKKYYLIIVSTTTNEFINVELGENEKYFDKVYSSLDYFGTAGKTKKVYEEVAKELKVPVNKILHIGDCKEMDIVNAAKAGVQTFYFDKSLSRGKVIGGLKKKLGLADLSDN